MTTDLEGDLRREFDAAITPSSLTFHPESVVRQGNRSTRRRRIMAGGSAVMAVVFVGAGASLLSGTEDKTPPLPPPATRTATSGIVRASLGLLNLSTQVELNRDPKVKSNVRFFVSTDDRKPRHAVGVSSTSKPGQKPEAVWKSGMVEGHPFTIGLVPGSDFDVKFARDASYGITSDELKGTGYSMFAVIYKNGDDKEAARPAQIASISWSGPTGIVDGIEGDHRLSGQVLAIDKSVSVKVVLRPGNDGRTTILGDARLRDARGGYATPLAVATTDSSGAAVVTGRYPTERRIVKDGVKARYVGYDGAPIAAGILPSGASNIDVILTTNEVASGLPVLESLPDGRVIFAVRAEGAQPSSPSKDSIKAVTWTNADGTKGRKDVAKGQR